MKVAPVVTNAQAGRVLVVDDVAANRELIRDNLEVRGWTVEEAPDGPSALESVRLYPPDVILLDVAMPGMDGLDVCRKLKADPLTAPIPVIMVTNHTERAERLAGIRAGANDYLAKPIDREDLSLRVQNAAGLKRLHDALQQNIRELKECERLRDSLIHMVVHDLRSPLSVISMSLETIPLLDGTAPMTEAAHALERARRATQTMADMISELLDISRLETGEMPLNLLSVSLDSMAREVVRDLTHRAEGRSLRALPVETDVPAVAADPRLVRRVFENLLGNALKFTPEGGSIEVLVSSASGAGARVTVTDTGPGIKTEYLTQIFDKFCQVQSRSGGGSGLGLAFCRLVVEAHGGTIGVLSDGQSGSTFWFELPLQQRKSNASPSGS